MVLQVVGALERPKLGRDWTVVLGLNLGVTAWPRLVFQVVAGLPRSRFGWVAAVALETWVARAVAFWVALLPHTLVGTGREAVLVEGEAALTPSVGFPRFKLGREGATATELAGLRDGTVSEFLPQTLLGVGREVELPAGRTVPLPPPSFPAIAVEFPRFKLGAVCALMLEFAAVRGEEAWPLLLLAKVIGSPELGVGRVVEPPLGLGVPRAAGLCRPPELLPSGGEPEPPEPP